MKLTNYLEQLDGSINIFGVGDLLKELHDKHGKKIRDELKGKIHQSLYYYWLDNQSPIKVKYLKVFKKYKKNISEEIFKKAIFFSAGNKKIILPKELTEDLAYLIGAFHGDGHISRNLKNMDLTEENFEYHEQIKNLFRKIFDVDVYIAKVKIRENIVYRSLISSKVIISFLKMYCPIGKKKGLLKVPKLIKKDKSLLAAYLSGFFDTDGCLPHIEKGRKKLYFVFSQADRTIVFEIYNCLKNLGLYINEPKSFKTQSIPYSGDRKSIQWKISIGSKKTLREFLKIIKFRHPLKKMRADKIIELLGPWSSSYDITLTN